MDERFMPFEELDVFERLVRQLPVNRTEQEMLLAIADLARERPGDDFSTWEGSRKRIAEKMEASDKTVQRSGWVLEYYGVLTIERTNGAKSLYRIIGTVLVDRPPAPADLNAYRKQTRSRTKKIARPAPGQKSLFDKPPPAVRVSKWERLRGAVASVFRRRTPQTGDTPPPTEDTTGDTRLPDRGHSPLCTDSNRGHNPEKTGDFDSARASTEDTTEDISRAHGLCHGYKTHGAMEGHGVFKFLIFGQGKPRPPNWPKSITERHLSDPQALEELWRIKIHFGDFVETERNRLLFFARAHSALRAKNPIGAFTKAVKRRDLSMAADSDDDWARKATREIDHRWNPALPNPNKRPAPSSLEAIEDENKSVADFEQHKAEQIRKVKERFST